MTKARCGILFNGKRNLFFKYLYWILKAQAEKDFSVSFVHTNNKKALEGLDVTYGSYLDVINNSDIVFSLGYWKKIPKEDIDSVSMGIVNFHHSYELKFKGRHCSTWALVHNEKVHGSTMHFIDEKIDEGKIIDSNFFYIHEEDVAEDLFKKANNVGFELLVKNFDKLISNEDITYHTKVQKKYSYREKDLSHEIDLELNKKSLLRKIRAHTFDKMPSPYLLLDGKKVYLKMEEYDDGYLKNQKNSENP
jgi:methionyl-tRNA formyltransferase